MPTVNIRFGIQYFLSVGLYTPPHRLSLVISVNDHVVEYKLVHGIHFDYYARRHFAATVGFYVQTILLLIICILEFIYATLEDVFPSSEAELDEAMLF